MVKALAPVWQRGCSWVWLSIVLGAALPLGVLAQPAPKSAAPKANPAGKGAATPKADDETLGRDEPAEPEPPKDLKDGPEVFRDKNTEAVLKGTFKALTFPPGPSKESIVNMANGDARIDGEQIEAYVKHHAAQFTTPRNVNALVNPPKNARAGDALGIAHAFDDLMAPVTAALRANKGDFLAAYTRGLLKVMPDLLKNNLFARVEGMVILSKIGDPQAVNIFLDQLNDRDQVVMVKLLAAHGLTTIVQHKQQIKVDDALRATRALNAFLNDEADAIWPAQFRALEALGSLRLPTSQPAQGRMESAETAIKFLNDAKARNEVRAYAAWALGMLRIENTNAKINYSQAAYALGKLAADLGDRIVAVHTRKGEDQAQDLTALLAYPVLCALKGENEVPRSGMVNSAALGKAKPLVDGLIPLIRDEAAAAITLERATGAQVTPSRQALVNKVAALRTFLDKNQPQVAAGVVGP